MIMKSAIIALALLTGTAAIAQEDMTTQTTTTTADAVVPAPMAPASGQIVAPSNADPEHDARGIAVISASAVVPPGFNGTPAPLTGTGGPLVDPADGSAVAPSEATTPDATYPACTREVTDNCLQTYERGRTR
jgi:hypothetical protein